VKQLLNARGIEGRIEGALGGRGKCAAWDGFDLVAANRQPQLAHLLSEEEGKFILAGGAGVGKLIESCAIHHRQDHLRKIGGVGGAADLVANESKLVFCLQKLQQLRNKILASFAKDPRGAQDANIGIGGNKPLLPFEFGVAVIIAGGRPGRSL